MGTVGYAAVEPVQYTSTVYLAGDAFAGDVGK